MRKAQKDPQVWLTNLVKTMLVQTGMKKEFVTGIFDIRNADGDMFYERYYNYIYCRVLLMSPATLGEIVYQWTNIHLFNKSKSRNLNQMGSGRYVLVEMATDKILSSMWGLLRGEQKIEDERQLNSGWVAVGIRSSDPRCAI